MKIEIKELTPKLWPDLERLFGANGACGGCWCMTWRVEKGETWEDLKGAPAKRRFSKLVKNDEAHGLLAWVDGEPVGWCAFDRRVEYVRLDRSPSFSCDDADAVWSLPCFFIKRTFRGKGVATAMLEAAIRTLRKRGARIIEGYPVKSKGAEIPAAFAWTGTTSLFKRFGFEPVGKRDGGKQRMRLSLQ
ncbi:MAG TPA: GNAT family N-acetyltransferase [bacterium]|nr:GNAT family N-acetyltransferase [bacterium]